MDLLERSFAAAKVVTDIDRNEEESRPEVPQPPPPLEEPVVPPATDGNPVQAYSVRLTFEETKRLFAASASDSFGKRISPKDVTFRFAKHWPETSETVIEPRRAGSSSSLYPREARLLVQSYLKKQVVDAEVAIAQEFAPDPFAKRESVPPHGVCRLTLSAQLSPEQTRRLEKCFSSPARNLRTGLKSLLSNAV
jgi:hypothetical protein